MPMEKEAGRLRMPVLSGTVESKSLKAPKIESWLDTIEAIIRVAWLSDNWLSMVQFRWYDSTQM